MLLGVMCSNNSTSLYRRLGHLGAFFFSPDDIKDKYINATCYEDGIKKSKRIPFPDVVYLRYAGRRAEGKWFLRSTKETLMNNGAKLFNYGFFNKWEIHKIIKGYDGVPETMIAPIDKKEMIEFLNKYPLVIMKPHNGTHGRGLMRIKGSELTTEDRTYQFDTVEEMVSRKKLNIKEGHLIQQGVELMTIHGRLTDFRVYAQRDRLGEWVITAHAAKISGEGALTTHTYRGGSVMQTDDALQQCFPDNWQSIKNALLDTCLNLARGIQSHYHDGVGEIGFDMGVDQQGKAWMFEANSRPGRSLFKEPEFREAGIYTSEMIVEYAKYLREHR